MKANSLIGFITRGIHIIIQYKDIAKGHRAKLKSVSSTKTIS